MNQTRKRNDLVLPKNLLDGDRFHYPGKTDKVWTAKWDKRTLYRVTEGAKFPERFPANKFMHEVVWLRNINDGKQATTA